MTLEEIKKSNKLFLGPIDICEAMGSDAQTVRVTARQYPERMGFPFTFSGNHMKIPRIPFLRWLGEEVEWE